MMMTGNSRIASTILTVATLCALVLSCMAWVSPPAHSQRPLSTSGVVRTRATLEHTIEATDKKLQPEYEMGFKAIQQKLRASIPEPYEDKMLPLIEHFAIEYVTACQTSMFQFMSSSDDDKKTLPNIAELCHPEAVAKRFLMGIQLGLQWGMGPDKYQFNVFHRAMRGVDSESESGNDVDLLKFGCDFFRPCIDMSKSAVLGKANIDRIIEQLDQGHNVIFFANHQSEADPQVISCLMEAMTDYGKRFEEVIYVAGHKVTTDPLAVPFSMGRNLLCIHSKKHIDADPETKPEKQKQNLLAISALTDRLKQGSTLLWLAPSGGRDRRSVETGEVPIAPFDGKNIDMFRLISRKTKVPTHFYSMSVVSYDLCPPPDFVEAGVGESRNIRFVPCGINVGNEMEAQDNFAEAVFAQCQTDYQAILEATN